MFVIYEVTSTVKASKHTECVSLSNQKYKIQPTLINSNLNEYSQELCPSPTVVNLDRCIGNCNTLDYVWSRICAPN